MKGITKVYHFDTKQCFNAMGTDFRSDEHLELHNSIFMFGKEEFVKKAVKLGMYNKVAHVSTKSLDGAFSLTQHIDDSWTNNVEVAVYYANPRSTSVGDILVNDEGTFIVAMDGFITATDIELEG